MLLFGLAAAGGWRVRRRGMRRRCGRPRGRRMGHRCRAGHGRVGNRGWRANHDRRRAGNGGRVSNGSRAGNGSRRADDLRLRMGRRDRSRQCCRVGFVQRRGAPFGASRPRRDFAPSRGRGWRMHRGDGAGACFMRGRWCARSPRRGQGRRVRRSGRMRGTAFGRSGRMTRRWRFRLTDGRGSMRPMLVGVGRAGARRNRGGVGRSGRVAGPRAVPRGRSRRVSGCPWQARRRRCRTTGRRDTRTLRHRACRRRAPHRQGRRLCGRPQPQADAARPAPSPVRRGRRAARAAPPAGRWRRHAAGRPWQTAGWRNSRSRLPAAARREIA